MSRILSRILLISGDMLGGDESLRRKVLRFTGSRRATRAILRRIDEERRRGPLLGCMIASAPARADSEYGDETDWLVRVSFASTPSPGGHHA